MPEITVLHTVAEVRSWRQQQHTIGFVPTMGALHQGHLRLLDVAHQHSDVVLTSIFVNPAQFAPHEDLHCYPRTLAEDLEKLSQKPYPVVVFAPSAAEMYPGGITTQRSDQRGTFVEVLGLSECLEGGTRPHFFRGVATVVLKLFNIVRPDVAVFGQKDVQQCCVLRRMARDLHLSIRIAVAETQRDSNGLALSSRNVYLTDEERDRASAFYRGMCEARDMYMKQDVRDREQLLEVVRKAATESRLEIEYISLSHPEDLTEVDQIGSDGAILSGAWRMGNTRLIDNMLLGFQF